MWPTKERIDALLDRCADNPAAVNDLLGLICPPLQQLIESRLDAKIQRRVDAADVLQEALIDIARRLPDYLTTRAMPFKLWVKQIAKDRIIDAHRRHRSSARRSIDREHVDEINHQSDASRQRTATELLETPEEGGVDGETDAILRQAIARLPAQDCEVLIMRHYERITNKEIAKMLGVTEPAISMRYSRAMKKLRELATVLEACN